MSARATPMIVPIALPVRSSLPRRTRSIAALYCSSCAPEQRARTAGRLRPQIAEVRAPNDDGLVVRTDADRRPLAVVEVVELAAVVGHIVRRHLRQIVRQNLVV